MKTYYIAGAAILAFMLFRASKVGRPEKLEGIDPEKGRETPAKTPSLEKKQAELYRNGVQRGLEDVSRIYGDDIARMVEKMYRLETNDFNSGQFLRTGSAGMEKLTNKYPYGWTTPAKLWRERPETRPIGEISMRENGTNLMKTFLVFADTRAGMLSLAHFLERYGRPGRWFATNDDEGQQTYYESKLTNIKTVYT